MALCSARRGGVLMCVCVRADVCVCMYVIVCVCVRADEWGEGGRVARDAARC